jgi:hypothetical protein
MLNQFTALAYAVLSYVMFHYDEEAEWENYGKLFVEPYKNGREQGFSIYLAFTSRYRATFAQYRASDEIIVYTGARDHFDRAGNTPSDAAAGDAAMFSCANAEQAALYALNYLKDKPIQ